MLNRIEKLLNAIGEDEAVFISSYPNIFYYSGFRSEDAYLLISHEKRYIVTDSRYTIQAKEQAPDFKIYDIKNGLEKLFSRIPERVIGIEEEKLRLKQYRSLKHKLGREQEFVEMQKIIDKPRRVKDEDEIRRIATAEEIGDAAFSHILPKIRAGVTEREIALEIEFFMKKQGASALSFDTIAASGARSAMPHGLASDKVIEKGDLLTLDFGCVYEGYCSDMTRTVAIGAVTERQREIYDIVLKSQLAAIDAAKAGKTCSYVDGVARRIITDAGYGRNFGHGLGHSVGIEIHESPSFSPKCNDVIKNGNVITVEPGIYIEDFCGVRIEDLIVIRDDKPVNLCKSPKELIIV